MRVLWFTNTPCGAVSYLKQNQGSGGWLVSLEKLVNQNCELHISFYHHVKVDSFENQNTHYHPIFIHQNPLQKILNLLRKRFLNTNNTSYLKHVIDKVQPDIIHIHGSENDFAKISDITSIPIILSIQGVASAVYANFNGGFSLEQLKSVKNRNILYHLFGIGFFEKMNLDLYERTLIENLYLGKIKYFFGRTHWDYQLSRVFSPKAEYFKLNEVLRTSFYECNPKLNYELNGTLKLFSICSNTPNKGFDVVVGCLQQLNKLGVNFEWQLAGLNATDEIVKLSLQKFGIDKIPTQLKFIGFCSEDNLQMELLNSDIFVFTSYIENSPNSLSEAMILGLPCVATNVGGVSSMICNNQSGLLFSAGDYYMLTGCILSLIESIELREKFGLEGRLSALKFHDKEMIHEQLFSSYNRILKKYNHV